LKQLEHRDCGVGEGGKVARETRARVELLTETRTPYATRSLHTGRLALPCTDIPEALCDSMGGNSARVVPMTRNELVVVALAFSNFFFFARKRLCIMSL